MPVIKSFLLLILLSLFSPMSHATKQQVSIGILAIWGEQQTREKWQPTIDYLNQQNPGYDFSLLPLKLSQTITAVKEKNIDFIITNPGNYILLEARFGISRLATLKSQKQHLTSNRFGAVIFTRADRMDINHLEDLENKSFMGVSRNAFGGFQMAWLEFKKRGIDPFTDFSSLRFIGLPQKNIVSAVLEGKVDAGTVRTSVLEKLAAEGKINLKDIKILNLQSDSDFPYLHSTPLYPEWPLAKLKSTDEELAKKLTIALLGLPADSYAARMARTSGWTVPLDYQPVRNLFQQLNLEPYKVQLPGFFERYWGQSVLFLILILQPLILYILKLRITVKQEEEKLALQELQWANALDALDDPMYMVDLDDRIIRANKAYYKSRNTTAEEAVGRKVTDFSHPEGEDVPCKVCQARLDLKDTTLILEPDDPANISGQPLEITIKVIRNSKNEPVALIQRMRNLSKERAAEKALRRNETLFRELLNATPEPLIVSNADGTIVLVNSQLEKEFGYARDEIIGHKVELLIPEQYRSHHSNLRHQYTQSPYVRPMGEGRTLYGQHKDGHIIPVDISLSPFKVDDEKLIISTLHNISSRMEEEKELKRLASFAEFSPVPTLEFNREGDITYANPASQQLFPDILKQGLQHEVFSDLEEQYETIKTERELIRNIEINEATYEQKIIYDDASNTFHMYIWDITRLRNLTREMTYQATHDALTSLINRREFEHRLQITVDEAQHDNKSHAVCYMDLDQFKAVNDACGHTAGDELLKQLSAAISQHIRDSDSFARLGGDEFGLLLTGCPIKKAEEIAEEIRQTVEDFRFHWDNKTFKVGISIGIVMVNNKSGSVRDIQSAADTACYIAKEQGRNRVHIYDIDPSTINRYTSESNWLNRIHDALDHDRFILYFQQIMPVNEIDRSHFEVLIRMQDDEGNIIPPSSFIPAAERFNVMCSIDNWVINNTLDIMQQQAYRNIDFSINLSGHSLGDNKFMENCIAQISASQINPDRICFEITETAMIANLNTAISAVNSLRKLGCKVALDDFGSGLSSFAYLKNLPVDFLKIDGSLIKDLDKDRINVTMVKSIIYIGHSMGLYTIAEYVENDAVLEILRDLHIDYVQGYGIGKPVPLTDISKTVSVSGAG